MSAEPEAMTSPDGQRETNGLDAARFVALADLPDRFVPPVFDALRRARIAAYAEPVEDGRRVYADAGELSDARPIARSAIRALDPEALSGADPVWRDPLRSVDADALFAGLVADWQVDTVAAVRQAQRDLSREDAEWRSRLLVPEPAPEPAADSVAERTDETDHTEATDRGTRPCEGPGDTDPYDPEDHYVPPPPPPLPRLALATVAALTVIGLSIAVLAFGGWFGLAGDMAFLVGVAGVLIGAGMLVMRLRERPDEDDDDGAIV